VSRSAARYLASFALALLVFLQTGSGGGRNTLKAENSVPKNGSSQTASPKAPPPADRLLEREAALSLKEQELQRLGETLDARIKQLEEARKGMETALEKKKKDDAEKYAKMLKVYKSLRPEAAAALLDGLDEDIALEMLDRMDQKTAAKLIPLMNRARVLKWTRQNLKGGEAAKN